MSLQQARMLVLGAMPNSPARDAALGQHPQIVQMHNARAELARLGRGADRVAGAAAQIEQRAVQARTRYEDEEIRANFGMRSLEMIPNPTPQQVTAAYQADMDEADRHYGTARQATDARAQNRALVHAERARRRAEKIRRQQERGATTQARTQAAQERREWRLNMLDTEGVLGIDATDVDAAHTFEEYHRTQAAIAQQRALGTQDPAESQEMLSRAKAHERAAGMASRRVGAIGVTNRFVAQAQGLNTSREELAKMHTFSPGYVGAVEARYHLIQSMLETARSGDVTWNRPDVRGVFGGADQAAVQDALRQELQGLNAKRSAIRTWDGREGRGPLKSRIGLGVAQSSAFLVESMYRALGQEEAGVSAAQRVGDSFLRLAGMSTVPTDSEVRPGTDRVGGRYARRYDSPFNWANQRVTNLAALGGVSLAGMGLAGAGVFALKSSMGQFSEAESQQTLLAGMVNTAAEFRDLQGEIITGQEKFTKSLEQSSILYAKIRQEARESLLTTKELMEYFVAAAPGLTGMGMSADQALQITDRIATLGRSLSLPTAAIVSDLRDLTKPTVSSKSQVLMAASLNRDELRAAYEKDGGVGVFNYVQEALQGYEPAFERLKNNPQAMFNRIQDSFQNMMRRGGETAFRQMAPTLERINAAAETAAYDGSFQQAMRGMGAAASSVVDMTMLAMQPGMAYLRGIAPTPNDTPADNFANNIAGVGVPLLAGAGIMQVQAAFADAGRARLDRSMTAASFRTLYADLQRTGFELDPGTALRDVDPRAMTNRAFMNQGSALITQVDDAVARRIPGAEAFIGDDIAQQNLARTKQSMSALAETTSSLRNSFAMLGVAVAGLIAIIAALDFKGNVNDARARRDMLGQNKDLGSPEYVGNLSRLEQSARRKATLEKIDVAEARRRLLVESEQARLPEMLRDMRTLRDGASGLSLGAKTNEQSVSFDAFLQDTTDPQTRAALQSLRSSLGKDATIESILDLGSLAVPIGLVRPLSRPLEDTLRRAVGQSLSTDSTEEQKRQREAAGSLSFSDVLGYGRELRRDPELTKRVAGIAMSAGISTSIGRLFDPEVFGQQSSEVQSQILSAIMEAHDRTQPDYSKQKALDDAAERKKQLDMLNAQESIAMMRQKEAEGYQVSMFTRALQVNPQSAGTFAQMRADTALRTARLSRDYAIAGLDINTDMDEGLKSLERSRVLEQFAVTIRQVTQELADMREQARQATYAREQEIRNIKAKAAMESVSVTADRFSALATIGAATGRGTVSGALIPDLLSFVSPVLARSQAAEQRRAATAFYLATPTTAVAPGLPGEGPQDIAATSASATGTSSGGDAPRQARPVQGPQLPTLRQGVTQQDVSAIDAEIAKLESRLPTAHRTYKPYLLNGIAYLKRQRQAMYTSAPTTAPNASASPEPRQSRQQAAEVSASPTPGRMDIGTDQMINGVRVMATERAVSGPGRHGRGINAGLIDAVTEAAAELGIKSVTISSMVRPDSVNRAGRNGRASRHTAGNAIDISAINGVSVQVGKGKELAILLDQALQRRGFADDVESGNPMAVLFRPRGRRDHYDHLHISMRGGAAARVPGFSDGGVMPAIALDPSTDPGIVGAGYAMSSAEMAMRSSRTSFIARGMSQIQPQLERYLEDTLGYSDVSRFQQEDALARQAAYSPEAAQELRLLRAQNQRDSSVQAAMRDVARGFEGVLGRTFDSFDREKIAGLFQQQATVSYELATASSSARPAVQSRLDSIVKQIDAEMAAVTNSIDKNLRPVFDQFISSLRQSNDELAALQKEAEMVRRVDVQFSRGMVLAQAQGDGIFGAGPEREMAEIRRRANMRQAEYSVWEEDQMERISRISKPSKRRAAYARFMEEGARRRNANAATDYRDQQGFAMGRRRFADGEARTAATFERGRATAATIVDRMIQDAEMRGGQFSAVQSAQMVTGRQVQDIEANRRTALETATDQYDIMTALRRGFGPRQMAEYRSTDEYQSGLAAHIRSINADFDARVSAVRTGYAGTYGAASEADRMAGNAASVYGAFVNARGFSGIGAGLAEVAGIGAQSRSRRIQDTAALYFSPERLLSPDLLGRYGVTRNPNGGFMRNGRQVSLSQVRMDALADAGLNMAGDLVSDWTSNFSGAAGRPGAQIGAGLGAMFGSQILPTLGRFAGPVGMVAGSLLGGLVGRIFGRSGENPEVIRHRRFVEDKLTDMANDLRYQTDLYRTAAVRTIFGPASGMLSMRMSSTQTARTL